jgi:pimeloyl-ACP methyl ester carboxylesterase
MMPAQTLPRPPFPGTGVHLFIRRTSIEDAAATRTVYVHGLGGSSLNWTDLMALRAPTSPGIALDLPGFGRSAPGRSHSLDEHCAAVVSVIRAEGAGPVHLVGNSLGGAVSTLVAARCPELVRTLTLVAPALPSQRPRVEHLPILLAGLPVLGERIRTAIHGRTPEERVDELLALIFHRPERVHPERWQEAVEEQRRRNTQTHAWDAFAQSARSLGSILVSPFTPSLWDELERVEAPVLGLFGAEDRLVDVAVATRAARRIARGRVVVMPDIGHVPQMEDPEQVAALMAAFESDFATPLTREC